MIMFDQASASDVTQESLLRAYHKIHLYNPQKSFAPWIFTIARRVALNETSYQELCLHYAENLSIREIGQIMGKTETGIKVTLFRARQKIQKAIGRGISL